MLSQAADSQTADPTEIAIAVVEHAGRYLIGQRPADVPLAGLWEFPGGKVQPGETPARAAARECLEETGLVVGVGELIAQITHQYDHGRVRLNFFACTPLVDDLSHATPTPPFCWATAEDLRRLDFPAANATVIELLTDGTRGEKRGGGKGGQVQ